MNLYEYNTVVECMLCGKWSGMDTEAFRGIVSLYIYCGCWDNCFLSGHSLIDTKLGTEYCVDQASFRTFG